MRLTTTTIINTLILILTNITITIITITPPKMRLRLLRQAPSILFDSLIILPYHSPLRTITTITMLSTVTLRTIITTRPSQLQRCDNRRSAFQTTLSCRAYCITRANTLVVNFTPPNLGCLQEIQPQ